MSAIAFEQSPAAADERSRRAWSYREAARLLGAANSLGRQDHAQGVAWLPARRYEELHRLLTGLRAAASLLHKSETRRWEREDSDNPESLPAPLDAFELEGLHEAVGLMLEQLAGLVEGLTTGDDGLNRFAKGGAPWI